MIVMYEKLIAFARNSLVKQLAAVGQEYEIKRFPKNDFGEPLISGDLLDVCIVTAIYHDSHGGYSSQNLSDGAKVTKIVQPMLLCLKEDCSDVEKDDLVFIQQQQYKIIAIKDINNYDFACDILLEAYYG